MSSSENREKLSEEQSLYNEGFKEISIAVKIIKAVRGNTSGKNIASRHFEGQNLEETWSRVKDEISELERDLNAGDAKEVNRIENFLEEDSQNLEDIVAYLIGAYLLGKDALNKIHKANQEAPPYMKDNFDVEGQKGRVEDISKAVYNLLGQIDSGIETAYQELRTVEQQTGNRDIEQLLLFFKEMHTCIQDFKQRREIDNPIRDEIKDFVEEEKQAVKEKEEQKREEHNQYHKNLDRTRF